MSTEDTYRLVAVRRAPLADPGDLIATLDWVVQKLETDDPTLFALSGYSPSMQVVPVLDGETRRIPAFLATSQIEWNFGRDPVDPTHEVALFNNEEGAKEVYLRVSFVAGGEPSAGPGLVVELRLGREAAGPEDAGRGAHLDKLFTILIVAFHPDFAHLEVPGHPNVVERPMGFDVGWLTYLSHAERHDLPSIDPPAQVVTTEIGNKIIATPTLGVDNHGDIAREIESVRDALLFRAQRESTLPVETAQVAVQKPTFMLNPAPLPNLEETHPLAGTLPLGEGTAINLDIRRLVGEALPFAAPGTQPTPPRVDGTPFQVDDPNDPKAPKRR